MENPNDLRTGETQDTSKTTQNPDGSKETATTHDEGGQPQVHEESHKSEPAKSE